MKALLWSMEYVLKTMHFENSHFADTVDQSEQSIVTVDQSELSIESAKCEYTKCVVFSTYSYAYYVALSHLRIHKDTMLNGCSPMFTHVNIGKHRTSFACLP